MRHLIDILLLFKEYFVLLLCVSLSLLLLASSDAPQVRTIRVLTLASLGALDDAFGFLPNYFSLREENAVLRERNLALSEELIRLREAKLENQKLVQLLGLKERSPFRYAAARVVGRNLSLLQNTVVLDAGERDGVALSMPIVTDEGLVGRITATSARYSVGQTLWHTDFRASAKVQRGRADGILVWEGGSTLSLRNVAKTLDVQVGDLVVTSEYSNIFPPGIKVGIVSRTSQAPGALFQTIEITPSADLARLEQVFVVLRAPDTTRTILDTPARR